MTGNRLEGLLREKEGSEAQVEKGEMGIDYWRDLKLLALDGNRLTGVGRGIGRLRKLETLHLRWVLVSISFYVFLFISYWNEMTQSLTCFNFVTAIPNTSN